MFRVGQKVVCIKLGKWSGPDFWWTIDGERVPLHLPVRGEVYTIRDIEGDVNGSAGFTFYELRNALGPTDRGVIDEVRFDSTRFRPVVERKIDISALKALLNPTDEQVRVLAMTDFLTSDQQALGISECAGSRS